MPLATLKSSVFMSRIVVAPLLGLAGMAKRPRRTNRAKR